jgi:hypothetical protein
MNGHVYSQREEEFLGCVVMDPKDTILEAAHII